MITLQQLSDTLDSRKYAFSVCVLLIAITLRFFPICYMEQHYPGYHEKNINEIEFYYDDVARSLIAGKGFVHSVDPRPGVPYHFDPGTPFSFVPPLYAWWMGLIYYFFGPNVFLAKVFQSFIDSIICLLIYGLGFKLFKRDFEPALASILYASYPLAIMMNLTLYYQIFLNIFLILIIWFYLAPSTIKNGLLCGLFVGLSALSKPITLPFVFLLPLFKVAQRIYHKKPAYNSILWGFCLIVSSILILTPWTIRNYLIFHHFIPVQIGASAPFIQGSKEEYIDLDVNTLRDKYGSTFGISTLNFTRVGIDNHITHLKEDPIGYARFLGKKFLLSWYNTEGKSKNLLALMVQLPYLFFALVALIVSIRFWIKSPASYVLLMILYVTAIQVLFFPLLRYTLAVMPLVMLITAHGIALTYSFYIRLKFGNS